MGSSCLRAKTISLLLMFAIFLFAPPQYASASTKVELQTIATGFTAPLSGVAAPSDSRHLYVVDEIGIIYRIDLVTGTKTVFLDVQDLLVPLGIFGPGTYDERGLLGLAFHPDFATNHLFYTFTTEPPSNAADFMSSVPPDHDNVIREWSAPGGTPSSTSRIVLRIENPQFNHTGGTIAFGQDKMLYIALGDGGGEDDQDCQIGIDGTVTLGHGPKGLGQDPNSILASILRIDPNPANPTGMLSKNGQYRIPADNPLFIQFASGFANVLPEVWAKGLRNPFRFSFDRATDQLIAGDVGQNDWEEVDIIVKGGNYGWRIKEATFLFDPAGCEIDGFVTDGRARDNSPGAPAFVIDPVAQYSHSQGLAVIGGFVYRGSAIPALEGKYVFGDYSKDDRPRGQLFTLAVPLTQPRENADELIDIEDLGERLEIFVLGFGQDANGELYVLGNKTGVPSGNTGVVMKIVPRR